MSCWVHNYSSEESDGKVQKSPHPLSHNSHFQRLICQSVAAICGASLWWDEPHHTSGEARALWTVEESPSQEQELWVGNEWGMYGTFRPHCLWMSYDFCLSCRKNPKQSYPERGQGSWVDRPQSIALKELTWQRDNAYTDASVHAPFPSPISRLENLL